MEFVNSNFVSVRDLDSIDDKINALSDERLRLAKALQHAGNSDSLPPSNDENVYIDGLVTSIQQLATAGSEEIVTNLIEQNGPLQVLVDLKEAVADHAALKQHNLLLKEAEHAEAAILALTETEPISAMLEAKAATEKFQGSPLGATLDQELHEVVVARKAVLVAQLTRHLDSVKWLSPKESVSIAASTLKEISATFADLVDLQTVDQIPEYPQCWWALQVVLRPFVVRFNYHFGQASDTNKISRPEWALQFVETFLHDSLPVLELVVANTFVNHGRIAVMEILTAALVPVREKLQKMVAAINGHIEASGDDLAALERNGRLLSHLIFETTSFDQRLRNAYKYNPYITDLQKTPTKKWMGLTGDILLANGDESPAANNWLSLELRLAKQRFDTEIVGAANAYEIDFEFDASSAHPADVLRPSYSAYALVKLFDNLTSHFKTLSIVKYQLKYVSDIQLTLLDEYLDALQSQFNHFNESLSLKLISNFLPGTAKADVGNTTQSVISNGLKGLQILTGIYCLIKFVVDHMQEWSEELLFIQLWNSYRSISTKKETEASIFGSTIALYNALLAKVATRYEEFFKREIRNSFKEYVNSVTWTIEDGSATTLPSVQLSTLTTIVPAYMSYLQRTLPEIDYFLVASQVCDSFSTVVHEYVITNNQFTKAGLAQLKVDIEYMEENLGGPLLMDPLKQYSNAGNRKYKKILQSIEMMEYFDAATAKSLKRDVESNDSIRALFDDGLDCLSERDIRDLLFRIV